MQQRGDTIIEVMVAFSVFAMVAVGALTVMNQGTASAQNTLETTLVRQQVDNQAEILRFLHQAYLADPNSTVTTTPAGKFKSIINRATTAPTLSVPTKFGDPCTQAIPGNADKRFALAGSGGMISGNDIKPINTITTQAPYAQFDSNTSTAYGLWIEPVLSIADLAASATSRYIDFHVRACWESASSSAPQRTLGTIIRLYVPESVALSTVPVPIPPTPPLPEATVSGFNASACKWHRDLERDDADGPIFQWGLFDPTPGGPSGTYGVLGTDCEKQGNYLVGCPNFDAEFNPSIPAGQQGEYDIVIGYGAHTGFCNADPVPTAPYKFLVDVYTNRNRYVGLIELSANGTSNQLVSSAFNLGDGFVVDDSTTLQLRWRNNHSLAGGQDPNLRIDYVLFKGRLP